MRKKERQLVTLGLIVLFGVIAWYAYSGGFGSGSFVDLNNQLNNTTDNTTYQLSIENLAASVDQATGHVLVSFNLANADKFNISTVQVEYALNVADPANATFTALNATAENGTYEAEIPSKFGDVVYYKVKVAYDTDKVLESDVQSLTVTDTTAPTATFSIDYNATTGNATITVNATDNDAIDHIVLFYAITADGNATTLQNVTLTTSPYQATLTIDDNTGDATYYYVDFYVEAYDLSGNVARIPANGTFELCANQTASLVFPQSG